MNHHQIKDKEELRREARERRIGRNCQSQVWCGFCQKIISLDHRGLEAWDERFNHIDVHFMKERRIIADYVPVDGDRPKGTPEDYMDDECGYRDTSPASSNAEKAGEPEARPGQSLPPGSTMGPPDMPKPPQASNPEPDTNRGKKRKRSNDVTDQATKRQRETSNNQLASKLVSWYCVCVSWPRCMITLISR